MIAWACSLACPVGAALRRDHDSALTTRQLTASCSSTCFGYTCDYWLNSCEELESAYGCDCDGCECPSPSSVPSASPEPTMLTFPPTPLPTVCLDLDVDGQVDSDGSPCSIYAQNTHWCGGYDNSDFTSNSLCCSCGGGDRIVPTAYPTTTGRPTVYNPHSRTTATPTVTAAPSISPTAWSTAAPTLCIDNDESLTESVADPYGDGCAEYEGFPSWCGEYDDSDFSSEEMCCTCGGGTFVRAPTVSPTVTISPTFVSGVVFEVTGGCAEATNDVYEPVDLTHDGRWYYRGRSSGLFIFFDWNCDGAGSGVPRWIFDTDKPSLTASTDLDGDSGCDYEGRIFSEANEPPMGTNTWTMYCDVDGNAGFSPVELTLTEFSPTAAPTQTTKLAIAPRALQLTVLKPNVASDTAYLVNLNDEIMRGSITPLHTSLPSNASWRVRPSNFTLVAGEVVKIDVAIDSLGLKPQDYSLEFVIIARTSNSLPLNQTFPIAIKVDAKADPATTQVQVVGSPTLDVLWRGIFITPKDADSMPISKDTGDNFEATLHSGNVTSTCSFRWFLTIYEGECLVPDTSLAGTWKLRVSLDGDVFYKSSVVVKCTPYYYENPRNSRCYSCPHGATCSSGTTLETLLLGAGYWRSGEPYPESLNRLF